MSAIARVRNKQIDTGKIINILVQAENNAEEILFHIEGEPELVTDFASLAFYLLYTRPGDTVPSIVLLEDASVEDGVIKVPFVPTSYFTANDGTVKIQLLISDIEINLSVNDDGTIDGSTLWQTFPAFLFVAPSQLNATETIIEENVLTKYLSGVTAQALKTEGFAVGEQNGVAVGSDSEYYNNNAKYYKTLAKDWASKTNGTVEGGEMSAKYYAGTADSRAKEAEGYAVGTVSGSPSATFAGKNAKELASDAEDWAKGTRSDGKTPSHTSDSAKAYAESAAASAGIVSDHATAIDAIYADLLNIDVVATDIQDDDSVIDAVAQNIANVNAVAGNESNINAVNSNKTNIDTVAGSISNVGTVAGNIINVNAVAGNTANINAVKTNESNINTVAGISSNVTTVAGIASDVTAVAGIASDVSAVEDIKTDVSAVASIDTDVSAVSAIKDDVSAVATIDDDVTTVATDISDVSTVASDITKVTAVADDLTNIDAVADDLTNIDNAVNYALEAEGWANGTQNGTPVSSGSPYYENNAKYWADAVPDLKSAIRKDEARITNLEEKADPTGAYKTVNYRGDNAVPTGKAKYALVESIVGKSRAWNQLQNITDASGASWGNGTYTYADGLITINCSANGSTVNAKVCDLNFSTVSGHSYLLYAPNLPSDFIAFSSNGSFVINTIVPVNFSDTIQLRCYKVGGYASAVSYTSPILVRDLTPIFPEGVPSTVAECVQKCPDILKYDAYGTSIVDTTVEGVVSNWFDGQTQDGYWGSSNGTRNPYSNELCSVNRIEVVGGVSYTIDNIGSNGGFRWYDSSDNYLTGTAIDNVSTAVAPSNAKYLRFNLGVAYGTTYKNDVVVHPTGNSNVLTLPSSVTLRSAGTVAEVYDLETGEKTNPLGFHTFDGTESWEERSTSGGAYYMYWNGLASTIKAVASSSDVGDILSADYVRNSQANIYAGTNGIAIGTDGSLRVYDPSYNTSSSASAFATHMTGKTITYALATPDPSTFVTPIIDNTLLTEGGGTINTIQNNVYPDESPAPTIDNSMDVGYLAL